MGIFVYAWDNCAKFGTPDFKSSGPKIETFFSFNETNVNTPGS